MELINEGLKAQQEGNFSLAVQLFTEAYNLANQLGDVQLATRCQALIQSASRARNLADARKKVTETGTLGAISGVGDDETILENIMQEQKSSEQAAAELIDLLSGVIGEGSGMGGGEGKFEVPAEGIERARARRESEARERLAKERERFKEAKEHTKREDKAEEIVREPRIYKPEPIYLEEDEAEPDEDIGYRPPPRPPRGPPGAPPKPSRPAGGMPASTPSDLPTTIESPPVAGPPPPPGAGPPAPSPQPVKSPPPVAQPSMPPPPAEAPTPVERAPAKGTKQKPEKKKAKADLKYRRAKGNGDEEGEEEETEDRTKDVRPKKIKRFGDVSAPMEMTEKKEYLVKIGLRMFKEDVVGMPVPMEVIVPKVGPPIIEVFVIGQDFKVDQPRRSLIVPLSTDSDILNFRVTPKRTGIRNLTVEFYQEGTLIGRAILKIVVKKKKEPVNESLSSTSVTVSSQFHDSRLDATLRIVRYEDDFFFSLFTPRAKAVVAQSALFGKSSVNMAKLHKLEAAMESAVFDRGNPRAAVDKLRALGAQIYNSIPKQIQKTIKTIEPKYLMIETGDLLVPWELAYDGDEFLSIKYCLGKRVFDETRDFRPPPFCIGKKILDVVFIGASPEGWPEISVKDEAELFDVYDQTKRINLNKLVEPNAKKQKVLPLLSKGDMVHLTCHGKFEEEEPLESALMLSDDPLTAAEIDDLEMKWPLIFANACSTGAISDKIVGIVGVARAFL
jgi:hypothetical protein